MLFPLYVKLFWFLWCRFLLLTGYWVHMLLTARTYPCFSCHVKTLRRPVGTGLLLLHHLTAFWLRKAWLATCSLTAPSTSSPTIQHPPGSLRRQRVIAMVMWTQIPHTPVHCDWRALRWEGTKCHSNRFFCVFVFASTLRGLVLGFMHSVAPERLPERLWEFRKQHGKKKSCKHRKKSLFLFKFSVLFQCKTTKARISLLPPDVMMVNYWRVYFNCGVIRSADVDALEVFSWWCSMACLDPGGSPLVKHHGDGRVF